MKPVIVKLLTIFVGMLIFPLINATPIYAETCCNTQAYSYNPISNMCEGALPGVPSVPISCLSNYICINNQCVDRNATIAPSPTTQPSPTSIPSTGSCCDSGLSYRYNPSTNRCESAITNVPPRSINCSSNQICLNNNCVSSSTPLPTSSPNDGCGGQGEACCTGETCDTSTLFCHAPPGYGNAGVTKRCVTADEIAAMGHPTPTPKGYVDKPPEFRMCDQLSEPDKSRCLACAGSGASPTKVWTGLGCIPITPVGFTNSLLLIAVGLGGGFALLLMIYGAFLISTSAGNPEQSQKGKEVIGGAIAGLLFIIFSVVILKVIGVDILQIPEL